MKKVLLFCSIMAFILTSCGKNSSDYQALKAQRDSLLLVNVKHSTELDEVVALLNEVENNFNSIKSAENYLSVQSIASGELVPEVKDKIRSDMQLMTEILSKNREKIAELESKLNGSLKQSRQLKQTLNKLRTQLNEKTNALVAMNEELEHKDQKIAELSDNIISLSKDVQDLKAYATSQQQTINAQTRELQTVYYCFGTAKELRKQHIITQDGQLSANFNTDYFIKVPDLSEVETIPLRARKGVLVSKHPDGSYEFVKPNGKHTELKILNAENFWSLTKYLVVVVYL